LARVSFIGEHLPMFQSFRFLNPGPDQIVVRVELWGEDYAVAAGSCLTLRCFVGSEGTVPTIEKTADGLTFWPEASRYWADIDGVVCDDPWDEYDQTKTTALIDKASRNAA